MSKQFRTTASVPVPIELQHPTSKWQEPARDDELTLWEVHRKPRKLVTKNRRIRCPLTMLNPQLRCVICLGYLKETTMVMVCLHRFCGECINKCIRLGMKECPSCRKPIPSRRSLRRDTTFDQIVNSMVGHPDQRQLGEDQRGTHDANKIVHLQRAIKKTKHFVDQQKQRTADSTTYNQAGPSVATTPPLTNLQQSPLLELELRRHPHEDQVDRLERGFLTIRGDAKVSILKTFLSRKLDEREYEISSTLDDDSVVLDDDLALSDAKESLCTIPDQVMVLKYRISATELAADEITASPQGGDEKDIEQGGTETEEISGKATASEEQLEAVEEKKTKAAQAFDSPYIYENENVPGNHPDGDEHDMETEPVRRKEPKYDSLDSDSSRSDDATPINKVLPDEKEEDRAMLNDAEPDV